MLKNIILSLLLFGVGLYCWRIHSIETQRSKLKEDRMEVAHIKYGLFNVDEWKRIIAEIISRKIEGLEITEEGRPKMKRQVEDILHNVLNEVELVIREENERSGIKGWLRGGAMDLFDVMGDVRKGIPRYADMLLDYIEDPRNKQALKQHLIKRFNELADKTVGEVDYKRFNTVLQQYGANDREGFIIITQQRMDTLQKELWIYYGLLAVASIALLLIIMFAEPAAAFDLHIMVVAAAALLITGVSLPMIDIEATITSFSFKLVGEPVQFTDQVLFFQSKSILQVVSLLLKNGGFGLVVVAILVFSFSVLVPLLKLSASVLTIARGRIPNNTIAHFLVFKSSKWSMADVMVVAIFMAYIGFNGVINSQLTEITDLTGNVQVFTTNNSVLQGGFYLFTAYVVVGLLLSSMIGTKLGLSLYHDS